MDIEQYLHTQFEMYPKIFRDVSVYLLKSNIKEALLSVPDHIDCHACGGQMLSVTTTSKKGVRTHYACQQCQVKSGEGQLSAAIAYWQFYASKRSLLTVHSPLVDDVLLGERYKKWQQAPAHKRLTMAANWVAGLKWMKWIWSQQRKTAAYASLPSEGKVFADVVGAAIDVLRKEANAFALQVGLDVTLEENAPLLARADREIKRDRLMSYKYYEEKLPCDMKKVLNEAFSAAA